MNVGNWLTRHAQNAVGAIGTLSRNPVATALTVTVIDADAQLSGLPYAQ